MRSALAIAALLALAWLVWQVRGRRSVDEVRTRPESPTLSGPALSEAHPVAGTESPTVAREAIVGRVEASEQGCLVRVVRTGTLTPVPEAELWIRRAEVAYDSYEWNHAMARVNDIEGVLRSGLGERVALDEHAEARLPRPSQDETIAAVAGRWHGEADLDPSTGVCVLELAEYSSLECEVVTADGRPLEHATVSLLWGEFDPEDDQQSWRTGPDGRISIPKLEDQLYGPRPEVLTLVVAGGARTSPPLVRFSLQSVPQGPVRFTVLDGARVQVQLVDHVGEPLALDGWASLDLELEPGEPEREVPLGWIGHVPIANGRVEFAGLGSGLRWSPWVAAEGREPVERVQVPLAPGEERSVALLAGDPLGTLHWIVRGRIGELPGEFMEGDGPIWELGIEGAHLWGSGPGAFEGQTRLRKDSDPEGPWEVALERAGVTTRILAVTPELDVVRGIADLGELSFPELAELARIEVVDHDQRALAGAWVRVESRARAQWTDAEGILRLHGAPSELPLRVQAGHEAYLPSAWTMIDSPGPHTLGLQKGGTLTGRLLLPLDFDRTRSQLHLDLLPEGSEDVDLRPDGEFRFTEVAAGTRTLQVRLNREVVHLQADIEPRAGETVDLAPIDLSRRVHPFTLQFELEGGAPWQGGEFEVAHPESDGLSEEIGRSGRASFAATQASVDLWAAGIGARPQLFTDVRSGARLVLPAGHAFVVRVPEGVEWPSTHNLRVRAWRWSSEDVPFETDADLSQCWYTLGADRRARIHVPWPGSYSLAWELLHPRTGEEFEFGAEQPQVLEVIESEAREFEARLPLAELAEASARAQAP